MTNFLDADCEVCPECQSPDSAIVYRRRIRGIYERRHHCKACKHRWNSWQSLLDPRKVKRASVSLPVDTSASSPT